MKKSVIAQYLERYAVNEVQRLSSIIVKMAAGDHSHFFQAKKHCLIIPAYAEKFTDIKRVTNQLTPSQRQSLLQIWVINCPKAGNESGQNATQQCFQDACEGSVSIIRLGNLFLRKFSWGEVLLVDCCREGQELPPKQGVGAARKIGADLALQLYHQGWLNSQYLAFTDADALLPADYFDRLESLESNKSAVVFPHRHQLEGDPLQQTMIKRYQRKLDYHVEGLRQAQSLYAYHSIGSLIACRWLDYAKVRGIPLKAAGEDFYFLNKLNKLNGIATLSGTPVLLSGRLSQRVPFGTGPAITNALQHSSEGSVISRYHPLIYPLLRTVLAAVPDFWESRENLLSAESRLLTSMHEVLQSNGLTLPDDIAQQWMKAFMFRESTKKLLNQSGSLNIFQRHFHCWFDGFRTLKFIHWWKDHGLASVPIDELK